MWLTRVRSSRDPLSPGPFHRCSHFQILPQKVTESHTSSFNHKNQNHVPPRRSTFALALKLPSRLTSIPTFRNSSALWHQCLCGFIHVRVHRRVDSPAVLFIFLSNCANCVVFAAYMIILLSRTIRLIVGVEGSWEKHSLCQLVC